MGFAVSSHSLTGVTAFGAVRREPAGLGPTLLLRGELRRAGESGSAVERTHGLSPASAADSRLPATGSEGGRGRKPGAAT